MGRNGTGLQVLLLHADERFRELVRTSLPREVPCWTAGTWERLREAARDAPPGTVVVVDPSAEGGGGDRVPPPCLESFLADHPWLPVVAAPGPGLTSAGDVLLLRDRGVAEVLVPGVEDTREGVARALRHARGAALRGVMRGVLPLHLPGKKRRLLFAAAEATAAGGRSPDLAAVLGVTETTVIRRCERLALPPPRRLLAWVRVLLAARLLDQPGRTAQSVANVCGYATEAGLRKVIRGFLGTSVTELRERGALETAAGAFRRELREGRAERGARG